MARSGYDGSSRAGRGRCSTLVPADAGVVAVVGAGAALAAALWGTAAFIWARRRGAGPATLVAVAASALSALLAAEGLVRTAAGALALHEGCYSGGPAEPELRLLLLDAVNAPLAPLRLAVMIAAALGTALILALARREPARRLAPHALLLPAGVFAVGVVAAALSRGLGHDVRHPPPLWRDAPVAASSGWIPAVDACPPERALFNAPEVRRRDDGTWLVDGARADDARGAVEVLRRKRDLWKQVQPKSPFPGVVYVHAGADASAAEIAPFVVAAREAGYPHIQGVQRLPAKHWPTHTLGDLPRTRLAFAAPRSPPNSRCAAPGPRRCDEVVAEDAHGALADAFILSQLGIREWRLLGELHDRSVGGPVQRGRVLCHRTRSCAPSHPP